MSWKKGLKRLADAARNPISMEPPQIGAATGDGVYIGQWQPEGLARTFNVFAAPQDLAETMSYVDAVAHVSRLKDWHGFDGAPYKNADDIFAALQDDSYDGSWIIPPQSVLRDHLHAYQGRGVLRGSFSAETSISPDSPAWYWSSTLEVKEALLVCNIRFADGQSACDNGAFVKLSCRPVRLVAV